MTKETNRSALFHLSGISRRDFLKLAAAAGLLAGCRPAQQPEAASTQAPTATATSPPAPTTAPTAVPTATPAAEPTATPTAVLPAELSKVVHTHHAGVWDGETLAPEAIRQMLDASITELTGLDDAIKAWASLFDPSERIAIKVNAFRNSIIWTHVPLVMAVTESLQEAGVPAEQIVIFDYYTSELETAGFPVNQDGPGVRCYGTDSNYTDGWQIVGSDIELSNIVIDCDALINMPVLKAHTLAGMSFAMKNHYGTFSRPQSFHRGARINRGMAELNALPPIKDHTRLIIGDVLAAALRVTNSFPYWETDWIGDSILMSIDPVAHDTVGLDVFSQILVADERNPTAAKNMASLWLESGTELGLGTNDLDYIDLVEMTLG